ncbi:MAG: ABC transporter permease subunit [Kiritimatiellaeota bacterium]|nr:ABC transporter permease subunit [Kiritimatiellota bacterium]
MLRYFLRRIMLAIPTFFGITIICFALTQFLPGGPVEQQIMKMRGMDSGGTGEGGGGANTSVHNPSAISEKIRADIIKHYGFDKPVAVRYWRWLVKYRVGMKMESYKFTDKTAWQLITSRIPVSLVFGITGFVLTYIVCVPLGIAKALRHGATFDFMSSLIVFSGYAMPAFALGMVLKMLFCGTVDNLWDFFPLGGVSSSGFDDMTFWGKFADRLHHMALPVLCYVAGNFAMLTLLMKNSLLEQMSADYIRAALAKGASRGRAVWRNALRNAVIPLATGFGGIMTVMFAGSVIIERVFEIPGMGLLSLESIETRDYPVFMGILALTSILGIIGQIISDACLVLIDPRIRLHK